MQKNEIYPLHITDTTDDGSGIGRVDGMAVFVPGGVPGDSLSVRILKVKKSYAYARIEEVLSPSENRVKPDCPVFARCGGCTYRNIRYSAQAQLKQNRVESAMRRIGGFSLSSKPIVAAAHPLRYRNKAQYPFCEDGQVGFYAPHSHRVVPCGDCLLQPEEFSKIAETVTVWIRRYGISVYSEQNPEGLLRHLYLRKAAATGQIMVVLVSRRAEVPHLSELVESLCALPMTITGIMLNIQPKPNNVILGQENRLLFGKDRIVDRLCGVMVSLSPLSFYQVNREMAEALYEKAAEYAQAKGKFLLDLYCGTGTIGLSMAKAARKVIGVEVVAPAVEDAIRNAAVNGFQNCEFLCADAASAAVQLEKRDIHPDCVILDPPRKGCEEALLQTVASCFSPERIVYVSCDPATLARDCAVLEKLGYELKEYTPFDLFPFTAHIETGNTKLSLPVLVNIAEALSVQTDALLYDTPRFSKTVASEHIQKLLDSCTTEQLYVIMDTLETVALLCRKSDGQKSAD